MRTLVVIPTYNEKLNVALLVEAIKNLNNKMDVLFVDDSSPDGTADEVKRLQLVNTNVHLLSRDKKEGLGRAYVAGMNWGLHEKYDIIAQMDADFSHRPIDLDGMVDCLKGPTDFVVGSRWVDGGGAENWNPIRRLISLGGSLYSRWVLGFPLKDWTGGFNVWKSAVLSNINLHNVHSQGYSFQIEMKFKALKKSYTVQEYPIQFELRRHGESKMSVFIFIEALYRVWQIRQTSG